MGPCLGCLSSRVRTGASIRICAVTDIIQYRLQRERMVERVMEGTLNLPGMGEWSARLYRGVGVGGDHLAL